MSIEEIKKKEIRKHVQEIRKSMTEQEHADKSFGIYNNVISLEEYKKADVVYAYCDVNNEAGTRQIISHALSCKKHVALPKITDNVMNFYEINSLDELKKGFFNIPEPITDIIPAAPDIVIVPGVAFSCNFDRLGYGGGFYDRFLSDDTYKIAIGFEFQVCDDLPAESHDKKVDMIVTEKNIRIRRRMLCKTQ